MSARTGASFDRAERIGIESNPVGPNWTDDDETSGGRGRGRETLFGCLFVCLSVCLSSLLARKLSGELARAGLKRRAATGVAQPPSSRSLSIRSFREIYSAKKLEPGRPTQLGRNRWRTRTDFMVRLRLVLNKLICASFAPSKSRINTLWAPRQGRPQERLVPLAGAA